MNIFIFSTSTHTSTYHLLQVNIYLDHSSFTLIYFQTHTIKQIHEWIDEKIRKFFVRRNESKKNYDLFIIAWLWKNSEITFNL
jgi:hypothetical protein